MIVRPLHHLASLLVPSIRKIPVTTVSGTFPRAFAQSNPVSVATVLGSKLTIFEFIPECRATHSKAGSETIQSGAEEVMGVGTWQQPVVSSHGALRPVTNVEAPAQPQTLVQSPGSIASEGWDGKRSMSTVPRGHGLDAVIQVAEQFVRAELEGNDASHDFWHIERVRNMALRIASEEGISGDDLQVVHLAALLHDVGDWKYSGSAAAGPAKIQDWLSTAGVSTAVQNRVLGIIVGVGFKEELASSGQGDPSIPLETAVVLDADRLDAIGAIGIARCFTYGGAKKRVLHDPGVPLSASLTQAEYMDRSREQTTINHFHEKLLKLKSMMKTDTGRRIAEQRHAFMISYLEEFTQEWNATL